jgi:A/G-specific adenine glycosylase
MIISMKKNFPWQILLDWYEQNGKHNFPWRQYTNDTSNEYRVWLAEILLQQTQADRVVPFYTRMLERYPTIHTLAEASYEEFFPYYQWLGYYSRARNLLKTAKIVSEEYEWVFPRDKSLLKKLPGVGEYTARAILAFGYSEPLLAWDTNLETIFSRYYKWDKQIKLTEGEKDEIEEDFRDFIVKSTENNIKNINNGLMDWARLMEPKNSNLFDRKTYIFKESEFYISGWETEIIEKKITQYFPIPDAQVIVTLHQDHKIYYSISSDSYSPFVLPPSENRDTRKYVQDYFRWVYGLELSVRPVHKKWITEEWKPYIAVNAQVQAGKYDFNIYTKSAAKIILSDIYSF